jgi:hypothetical protein
MSEQKVVRSIWSADRKHRLEVFQRPDGNYGFVGLSQFTESGRTFWTPTEGSGIYETADMAEQEAVVAIPWMKSRGSD